jgi:hypothetical protein
VAFDALLSLDGLYLADRYKKGPVFVPSTANTLFLPYRSEMTEAQAAGDLVWAAFAGAARMCARGPRAGVPGRPGRGGSCAVAANERASSPARSRNPTDRPPGPCRPAGVWGVTLHMPFTHALHICPSHMPFTYALHMPAGVWGVTLDLGSKRTLTCLKANHTKLGTCPPANPAFYMLDLILNTVGDSILNLTFGCGPSGRAPGWRGLGIAGPGGGGGRCGGAP